MPPHLVLESTAHLEPFTLPSTSFNLAEAQGALTSLLEEVIPPPPSLAFSANTGKKRGKRYTAVPFQESCYKQNSSIHRSQHGLYVWVLSYFPKVLPGKIPMCQPPLPRGPGTDYIHFLLDPLHKSV